VTSVAFHPAAQRELITSAKFYEDRAPGLGADFIRQVERAVAQISANPESGPAFAQNIRRRLLPRFPFAILYQLSGEELRVLAIMHLRRRPGYWKSRLRDQNIEHKS